MSRAPSLLTHYLFAAFAFLGVVSCGGGGVSGPPPVQDPSRITILPGIATLYSGVPTTFVISGGTGSYIVSSSNQSVVPISSSVTGNALVVTPNHVGADTEVTLTVRDTGTTPTASATVVVRPGTVSNEVTITPTSTQGLGCAPAICSGGDAEVAVTLSQAGAPLIGRAVRFDAVTGDYRFITSSSASPIEVLETSTTVVSDQSGRARTRIRVLPSAPNQTALLQVTDTNSGAFQRTSFAIAQATGTSPGFFAAPASLTFAGTRQGECAGTNISGMFYVFGGTPPYVISNTFSGLIVRPDTVAGNGGSFTVTPTGSCLNNIPVVIRDAAGRTTTVSVSNVEGTVPVPALAASPSTVNLSSCDATANVQVAGGRGTYFVASGSDSLVATVSGSTVTVRRRNPSGPAAPAGNIGISDGTSVVNVTVEVSGAALGQCPSPILIASPTTITLTDCSSSAQVFLSGGSGAYTAVASSGSISTTISGNVLSIRRASGSGTFSGGSVTVSDGTSSTVITVQATGTGAGSCGGGGLSANPNSVTLLDCSSSVTVSLSGGSGTVTATPSTSSLTASVGIFGSSVTIRRTNPSGAFGGGSVEVADQNSSITIAVAATGEGAGICPAPPPPITVSPSTLTLNDCNGVVQATISGGTGTFSASSDSGSVLATVSGRVLSVRRANPSSAFTSATVIVSDGTSAPAQVAVNGIGSGGGACPTPAGALTATPSTVNLTDCAGSAQVNLSGGTGTYTATSESGSIVASVTGSVLSIRRAVPSAATSGGIVRVSDGASIVNVGVTTSGAGAGACSSPINATPNLVQLTDCTSPFDPSAVRVTLSGGSGSYIANSNTTSVEVTAINATTLAIGRRRPSSAFGPPATVAVTDTAGSPNTNITVDATPGGAAACPP